MIRKDGVQWTEIWGSVTDPGKNSGASVSPHAAVVTVDDTVGLSDGNDDALENQVRTETNPRIP